MEGIFGFHAQACQTSLIIAGRIRVEKCERSTGSILPKRLCADAPHFGLISCLRCSGGQIAKHLSAPIFDDPLRHILAMAQGDTPKGTTVKILEYKDMEPFFIKGERDEP